MLYYIVEQASCYKFQSDTVFLRKDIVPIKYDAWITPLVRFKEILAPTPNSSKFLRDVSFMNATNSIFSQFYFWESLAWYSEMNFKD